MDRYSLKCVSCGSIFSEQEAYTRCLKCSGPLDVDYDYDLIEERLNLKTLKSAPIKATKYFSFYPIKDFRKCVTLDEGGTPLDSCRNLSKALDMQLYIKNEGQNPTGAFKDRGSMVEISKAVELGYRNVCCASSGNMAASVSAYSSKVNLPCYVLVPEGTTIGKLAQTLSYGARVLQIKGTYNDAEKLTERLSRKYNYYLAGDYTFRIEGQKSQAFEIIEQLDWNAPDYVIVPMGCGTNISAVWKGFREFHRLGLVNRLPRLIGVQARGANPIVEAFRKNRKIQPIEKPDTVAGAINVGNPLDGVKALKALRESGGLAVDVSDDEMLEAQQLLANSESIFAEPAAVSTIAAVVKLKKKLRNRVVAAVLTGNGLKDPIAAIRGLAYPPAIEPDFNAVSRFVKDRLYNVKAPVRVEEKARVVFSKEPTYGQVKKAVAKIFNIHMEREELGEVYREVSTFFEKGKRISRSDFKSIIEEVLSNISIKKRVLRLKDFYLTSRAHERPRCRVTLEFKGKVLEEQGVGDGPVDAAINAIKIALKDRGIYFELVDYAVRIDTGGTSATVD
ncbi:threonine synthase, partial [Candidatus Micrarchaeota archaeon]|nr:threonine synthase [Candidatus Micrarchaeota archaeon]